MNKKAVMIFLLGWAVAILLPPSRVVGFLKGQG